MDVRFARTRVQLPGAYPCIAGLYGGAIGIYDAFRISIVNPTFTLNNCSASLVPAGRSLSLYYNASVSLTGATFPTSTLAYTTSPYEVYVDSISNITSCTLATSAMASKVIVLPLPADPHD